MLVFDVHCNDTAPILLNVSSIVLVVLFVYDLCKEDKSHGGGWFISG